MELKIMNVTAVRPLSQALANKLFDQNVQNHFKQNTKSIHRHSIRIVKNILSREIESVSYHIFGKFTIVEIVYGNHHYHGLAARAPCDRDKSGLTGIAIAYHRAFKALCEDIL